VEGERHTASGGDDDGHGGGGENEGAKYFAADDVV